MPLILFKVQNNKKVVIMSIFVKTFILLTLKRRLIYERRK